MAGETVDASIVFLPRLTTLVGQTGSEFTTLPLDVSQYSGAQFQVWRGSMDTGTFTVYLEESLDAQTWVLGPSTPAGFELSSENTKFFSYSFRLRWFRLRIAATGIVTCWAEGLLRGGGAGAWPAVLPAGTSPLAAGLPAGAVAGPVTPPAPDIESKLNFGDVLASIPKGPSSMDQFLAAVARAKGG